VNSGHDVTTPEEAYEALVHAPLRNTIVSMVDFDVARLKELEAVLARAPVTGSSFVRHAVYTADGVLVDRHSGIAQPILIPQKFVNNVLSTLPSVTASGTVTGVKWGGQKSPAIVTLSRRWGKAGDVPVPDAVAEEEFLPCVVVRPEAMDMEFVRCTSC